jgi:hypothetical protein
VGDFFALVSMKTANLVKEAEEVLVTLISNNFMRDL